MSSKIPKVILDELRQQIYLKLDSANYLSQSRQENGQVMDQLVKDPEIGGKIAQYTGHAKVKTYIKDTVINRYAKERTKPPKDLTGILGNLIGKKVSLFSDEGDGGVKIFKTESGELIVVGCGRLMKWESALRKLLEHIARNKRQLSIWDKTKMLKVLILMSGGRSISSADRTLLEDSLEAIGVKEKII